jgi:hypothetical protein
MPCLRSSCSGRPLSASLWRSPCRRPVCQTECALPALAVESCRGTADQVRRLPRPATSAAHLPVEHRPENPKSRRPRPLRAWQGPDTHLPATCRCRAGEGGTARRGRQYAGVGRGGSFSDSLADGNAIYLYRIDGGTTCGLPTSTAQPAPGPGGPTRREDPSRRRTATVGRLPTRASLRSGRLVASVTCTAPCTIRSRLTMRGASRRIPLASCQHWFAARTQS